MSKKILVVDDDEAVLDYLQAKLGVRYDLVLTAAAERGDAPGAQGDARPHPVRHRHARAGRRRHLGALYGDDETRDIPVLFLSALVPAKDAKRGEVGGRPAISKSAPIEDLIARIESLMG